MYVLRIIEDLYIRSQDHGTFCIKFCKIAKMGTHCSLHGDTSVKIDILVFLMTTTFLALPISTTQKQLQLASPGVFPAVHQNGGGFESVRVGFFEKKALLC